MRLYEDKILSQTKPKASIHLLKKEYLILIHVCIFAVDKDSMAGSVTSSCDLGQYMAESGSLSRLNYTDNESMEWIVGKNVNENTTLVFTEFETEACCDYVLVYSCTDESCSAVATLLAELRGALDLPYVVTSTTGILKIVWHSDDSIKNSGWSVAWSTVSSE